MGGSSLSANFRWKGTSPTNLFWCQNTRLITLSCGFEILPVFSFISSQSTRVTDGRTDRQTDRRRDRQNYDPQDRASIAASRGKIDDRFCYCQIWWSGRPYASYATAWGLLWVARFFTPRSSYAILRIVILSVRLSVRHTRALWRKKRT